MRAARAQVLRRVGVLGDIHAEDARLQVALAALAREGVDRVLATGDVVDGPGDVARCCALLKQARAVVVRGNHERWLREDAMRDLPDATRAGDLDAATWETLGAWPAQVTLETVVGPLLLCHGLLDDDMNRLLPEDSGYALEVNKPLQFLLRAARHAVVVHGHTHRRMVRTLGKVTFINAGTLFATHAPCFAVVDFPARRVQFTDFQGATDTCPGPVLSF